MRLPDLLGEAEKMFSPDPQGLEGDCRALVDLLERARALQTRADGVVAAVRRRCAGLKDAIDVFESSDS